MVSDIRSPAQHTLEKIRNHTALVGKVGLGYVGLPFPVEKAKVGYMSWELIRTHSGLNQRSLSLEYTSSLALHSVARLPPPAIERRCP
jgi:hypothetical protein